MCLQLVTEREQKLRVAKKDIEVFKICCIRKGTIVSYYYNQTWDEFGKIYKTKLLANSMLDGKGSYTSKGFYSYQKNVKIKNYHGMTYSVKGAHYGSMKLAKVKCIIPKGSHYYHADEQYVSDQIIPISYKILK